jgi:GT2 family glycosyltransferase
MSCDIIVVVWNQLNVTRRCLKSLSVKTLSDYRLILIDNASNDETKNYLDEFVKEHENETILISNKTNVGFLKAANQGLKKSTARYACLLNNDTVLTEGWLKELMDVADKNPDLGILNPSSNTLGQKVALKDIDKYASKIRRYAGEFIEMAQASGFCMFIKREVIDKIGYLDESYGLGYFEDTDYSRRAKEAGFKIARIKASYVYHQENASFVKLKSREDAFSQSRRIFEERWGRPQRIFVEAKKGLRPNEIQALLNFANKANWIIIAHRSDIKIDIKHSNIKFLKYWAPVFYIKTTFKILKRVKKKYNILIIRKERLRKLLRKCRFIHKAEVLNFYQALKRMK